MKTTNPAPTNSPPPGPRGIGHSLLALATATMLTACVPASGPPAGTPRTSADAATHRETAPTGSPHPSQQTTGSNSPAPASYEPATPTSPAKNVTKPVIPALAKDKSEAGQRAFIEYWLETYNYMRESGDTKPFLAACHKDSKFCQGSVENLKVLTTRRVWRIGGKVWSEDLTRRNKNENLSVVDWTGVFWENPSRYF